MAALDSRLNPHFHTTVVVTSSFDQSSGGKIYGQCLRVHLIIIYVRVDVLSVSLVKFV